MRKMRKMRNCAQLSFVARKMRKFAPTRKPVALETLNYIYLLLPMHWMFSEVCRSKGCVEMKPLNLRVEQQ